MCIATTCNTCGKQTWKGCGLHIEAALSNVTLEARCKGWETGKCQGVEESKEDGPLSCKNIESKLREGFEGIKVRVDSGEFEVAFTLFPVSIKQFFDIADSGNIMPPKSTWFEPKLRTGVIVRRIEA